MLRSARRRLDSTLGCVVVVLLALNAAAADAEPQKAGGSPALADKGAATKKQAQDSAPIIIAPPTEQGTQLEGAFFVGAGEIEMGSGSFILEESSRNEYVAWNASLLPSYRFSDRTRVSMALSLSQELTQSDSNSVPHQLLLSDLRLAATRPLYTWESSQTQIAADIGIALPLSLRSQFEGLYTSLDLRLKVQQPVGDFFFSFRTGVRKNFHKYTTPILSEDDLAADAANGTQTELARSGGAERIDAGIAVGLQNNVSLSWSNMLMAAYSFTDKFSLTLAYALGMGWGYESYPTDELTASGAQSGNRRGDSSTADIVLSYQALESLAFETGVRTMTTPRTSDDKSLRFPFYDFSNAELNLSVFYLSATFSEKL